MPNNVSPTDFSRKIKLIISYPKFNALNLLSKLSSVP